MADKIQWGILSTGNIAGQFARDLRVTKHAELAAVASRTLEKAEAFADEHNARKAYGSYEALAADPELDVVYIGTPHSCHKDDTLLCLKHGKHVLCEKPFALNTREVEEMINAAHNADRFLMEAMWMYFIPSIQKTQELVRRGVLGEVRMVRADFAFQADLAPGGRLTNPALGGGALLDIGIYPLALAQIVFASPPESVTSAAHFSDTGVDLQSGIVMQYDGGACAVLSCSLETSMPQEAVIAGTKGTLRIPNEFYHSDALILCRDGAEEVMTFDRRGIGYYWEAEEVGRCIRQGQRESSVFPHRESLALMDTMDRIRDLWGLTYPGAE